MTRSASFPDSPMGSSSRRGWTATSAPRGSTEDSMATATTDHYRAYTPRPFTRAERDSVTILFGGLHWRIERIIQGVLESSGYKAQILPVATKDDLLTGREVADIGQCCPTSFTTGNLVNFLKKEASQSSAEEVSRKFVYLTAGSCGACRFGQYHQSYELALRNSGLEMFRMFLMAQDNLDQKMGDGLDLNLPMTLGCLWGIFCTDLIQDLEYQTRPYEVLPGQTEAVVKQSVEDYSGIEKHARLKLYIGRAVQGIYRLTVNRLRRAMGDLPHASPSQFELRRLAAPYFHRNLDGGEGDMLVGKSIWAYQKKKAHMICELSPYSCMPNTMSIGAMSGVLGKFPEILYAPLEIKGDAEVHALSRCQMILTEAKKRAQREFDDVLTRTGLTVDEVRAYLHAHPEMRKATYRIPHDGAAAGTAAKLVLHVAKKMGRSR